MFKKADKHELRTWLIGDGFITICLALASVILLGSAFNKGFKLGSLIWGIVFTLLTVLLGFFFVIIIKNMISYDARAEKKAAQEAEEKAKLEAEQKDALEQEKAEMEALKEQELQKRAEVQAEIEAMKAEKEARGEKFGEDEE